MIAALAETRTKPGELLREAKELLDEAQRLQDLAVAAERARGTSWETIGEILDGVTKSAAQKRYGQRVNTLTKELKIDTFLDANGHVNGSWEVVSDIAERHRARVDSPGPWRELLHAVRAFRDSAEPAESTPAESLSLEERVARLEKLAADARDAPLVTGLAPAMARLEKQLAANARGPSKTGDAALARYEKKQAADALGGSPKTGLDPAKPSGRDQSQQGRP
ncbi:hypothetical protein ASD08_35755 [Streptomyces sp. Root369]|nr:hypothetical protein ASD08_35755 [Streptomyces sp. Root369]